MTYIANGPGAENLLAAIAALEAQRSLLGDAVVNPAVAALRQQLAALHASTQEATPMTEERRIVSILFSDIVGSTTLAERLDPEDWRNLVAQVHQRSGNLIKRNNGHVLQYLGDGLLAIFGAFNASESDPANAVQAALEIQTSLTSQPVDVSIHLRIGIHTGLVVVGEIGSESKREFTATGDAMNLAARLQSAAPPGGVLISHDTFRHVRGLYEMEPQPLLQVKGKADPIQTYLVLRADQRSFVSTSRGVAGVRTSTIGRTRELEQVHAAIGQVFDTAAMVWVQLIGEPGMGKSNLLNRVRRELESSTRPLLILKARSFEGDDNEPYALVRDMWFEQFQIAKDDSLANAEHRWLERFLELCACNDEEAAHALGLMVGLQFTSSPHIRAMRDDPTQVRGRGTVVSRELIHNLRMQAPVVILMEDLHWADPSSIDYLNEVLLQVEPAQHGLFVLATARPEWKPANVLANDPLYWVIPITALPQDLARELAHELMQQVTDVSEEAIDFIVAHAEGVPYFAEEIVNWFLDQNIIRKTGDSWQFDVERLQKSPLPATLQLLLSTRIEALDSAERTVLQHGAVVGRNFWEDALVAIDSVNCKQPLEDLQVRRFVDAVADSTFTDSREWSFHHSLLHDVAYESVLKRERRRLHKLVADWLEKRAREAGRLDEFAGMIGDYLDLAGEPQVAVDWLMKAGKYAFARGASREARSYYERVLKIVPESDRPRHWNALLGLSDVLEILGDLTAYQAVAESMMTAAGSLGDRERAQANFRQGYVHESRGKYTDALTSYLQGVHAAEQAGDTVLKTTLNALATICHQRLGDRETAASRAEDVLAAANLVGHTKVVRALTNLATYYVEAGDLGRSSDLYQEQVGTYRQTGDRLGEATALSNLGYNYLCLGLYEQGRASLEQSIHLCQAIGSYRTLVYNQLNLALALFREDDLKTALHLLDSIDHDVTVVADEFAMAAAQLYRALILEGARDCAGANEHFAKSRQVFNQLEVPGFSTDSLAGMARCELAQGQLQTALVNAIEVWEYLQRHGAAGMEFPVRAYLTCVRVFEAAGESARSREALDAGYIELHRRAGKIDRVNLRDSFLTNVTEHRALSEYRDRFSSGSE